MKRIRFTDSDLHLALAPLSLTRPLAEIRFGILSNRESWEKHLERRTISIEVAYDTEDYLHAKYNRIALDEETLSLAGNVKPSPKLVEAVLQLKPGASLFVNETWIATLGHPKEDSKVEMRMELFHFTRPWHIFQRNEGAFQLDFDLLTEGRISHPLNDSNRVTNPSNIFVEEGAIVNHAILNASYGPIYIGKSAEIMEGSMIRGAFALLDNAVVKMGAKIYGPTTIGPYCKVGGEISNSVFQAYSNKGHDGFLGNSVIGEWCNLGADTNSSNLKNNYSPVKVYNYTSKSIEPTDVLFCGVLMGDHSKTGINTMLNTGTCVGVCANIFDGGFPPKYIPSFSWGGQKDAPIFLLEKAFEVATNMMKRRNLPLTDEDRSILKYLFTELA